MSKKLIHKRLSGVNVVALTALAGLLIWAKLRLVTDFPRTVQADPPESEVDGVKQNETQGIAPIPPTHLGHDPLGSILKD